jgi:hypothetical protein
MDENDNLFFSFEDEEEPGEATPEAEEGQNRSFLIGAIVLAAVFVLGICAVLIYFLVIQPQQQAASSDIELTNAYNMTMAAATQTAQVLTQAAPTQAPEETEPPAAGTEEPTSTATSAVAVTVVGTEEGTPSEEEGTPSGTEVAEVTPGEGTPTSLAPVTTGTPGTPTRTPTVVTTSGLIEVTPLGGPTPTRIAGGGATGVTPTGVGGPLQPSPVSTLPTTGFSGGAGLAGAGLLAVVLVAVVVVVRRLRLK